MGPLLSFAFKSVAGCFAAWHALALAIFFHQELKVGWPKFERKVWFCLYGASIFSIGSVQQFFVLATYFMRGPGAARKMAYRCQIALHSFIVPFFFAPIEFEGASNLPPSDEGCIYIANHTSSVDMSVANSLPTAPHLAAVAKKAIFAVPGLGAITGLAGGIFINRAAPGGALASMVDIGKQRLAEGISIGVFPQGTRKVPKSGQPFLEFKKGAFVLADQSGAKVVPMTFIYPRDFMCRRTALKVIIHPVVTPSGDGDVETLRKSVEAMILAPIHKALD